MERIYIQTALQRYLVIRTNFMRNIDMHRMGEYLVSGCIDAPEMRIAQFDPVKGEWMDFDFRDE
jgi:hypothetical protein